MKNKNLHLFFHASFLYKTIAQVFGSLTSSLSVCCWH